jgi:hypothetical protein
LNKSEELVKEKQSSRNFYNYIQKHRAKNNEKEVKVLENRKKKFTVSKRGASQNGADHL